VAPLADPNSSRLHRRRPTALLIGQPPNQGSAVGPAPASQENGLRNNSRRPWRCPSESVHGSLVERPTGEATGSRAMP
jgi:hypothetical protein